MLAPFYFSRFEDEILLTNDMGNYCFLTEKEFQQFTTGQISTESELWGRLEERGMCYSDSRESFVRKHANLVREEGSYLLSTTSLFILAVTNACNHRCQYCQANGQGAVRQMSIEVAEAAIQKIAEVPAREITIEFQGGEPLMNFKVIKYIVERAKERLKGKEVQFTVVSNLTLLTDEIADFLVKNSVSVSTSLDGPRELHDQNRPLEDGKGSYEMLRHGCEMLQAHGIQPGAIQTTTRASLPYAKAIVDEYLRNGFRQVFLRPLTRLGAAARCWDRIGYKSSEFIKFYRDALEYILKCNLEGKKITEYHAALFLKKILQGRSENYMDLRSPCGAGIGQVAITANGNVYTCDEGRMMAEMGDEAFLIGNVFRDGITDWIGSSTCEAICSASLLDTLPGCCDCIYKPYCGVCPVVNYAVYGNITHVSKERCDVYRGILDVLFEYIHKGDPKIMEIFSEWSEGT